MPRPRAVDDAPAPRFNRSSGASDPPATHVPLSSAPEPRPAPRVPLSAAPPPAPLAPAPVPPRPLVLVEAPEERREAPAVEQRRGPRERTRSGQSAEEAMLERAERIGLSIVDPAPGSAYRWDESRALIEREPGGRRTSVITGHPEGVPRPLPVMRAERRRSSWMPAEWIASHPERIVGWAFALGLLLILIAISTADAATL
jgi:hypothetical protein